MPNRKETPVSRGAKPDYNPRAAHDVRHEPDNQFPWHTSDSFTPNDPPLPIQHSTNSFSRVAKQDDPMMDEANAFLPTYTRDPDDEGYRQ